MLRARAALLCAVALALPCSGALVLAEEAPASFEYLHVEANEGGASGGHAAIRFAAQIFHFQHHDGAILRLHRDDAVAFMHTYARLQNRPLHVQRVAVAAQTYELLRRRFSDRFLREAGEFATLDLLRRERDLLAQLMRGGPAPAVRVRGAGFLAAAVDGAGAHGTLRVPALVDPAAAGAPAAVARRREEVEAELARLASPGPAAEPPAGPHLGATALPALAQRAAELLEAQSALEVLERGATLRPDAVRTAPLVDLELAPDEVAALRRFASQLDQQVAALISSTRPDFGSVLLLALARRAVLEQSIASGSLAVLDAYPEDATRLAPDEVRAHASSLPGLLADARADLTAARRALGRDRPLGEADYTRLESATNRFLELHAAITQGSELRLASGPLLPAGATARPLPAFAVPPRGVIAERLATAEARLGAQRSELEARYAYDLLTRNCVSEIFHEIAAALATEDAAGGRFDCSGSAARLGGCIDPRARLRFIPFVSAAAVADEYPVIEARDVPSYRAAALAEMYARENDLAVFLRESNVVTSTIYQRHDEDSRFLFFTDDAVLTRPLFGAVNLVTGIGASAAGLLMLASGDDELLVEGLRGALFSLPELAFVSLRKGSFAYVPRADGDAASAPLAVAAPADGAS